MPLAESKAIRGSEAVRSIPSSNIKFRVTENLDPIIHKMVHSKETVDNLPKFIELINKVAVPHLKTVYEDFKMGIQLEAKKKQHILFFQKLVSNQHFIELKLLNKGFAYLKSKAKEKEKMISKFKAKGASLLYNSLNSKINIHKCFAFSNINLKTLIDVEFTKNIKDKIFDQPNKAKTSPTHTTESPIKSQKSSKVSQSREKTELEKKDEEFSEENKEKVGKILENLNKKCSFLEKMGEKAFNQWKIYTVNKEKSNILISYALRNMVNKVMIKSFEKIQNYKANKNEGMVSDKILKFSNVIHDFQKKIWFLKLKTFSKIRKHQSPFKYMKQLNQLINTFKTLSVRRLLSGFNGIKSIKNLKNLKRNEILTSFFYICLNYQKNYMRSLFSVMRGNVVAKTLDKTKITNRIKGKILISCSKQAPLYSLKNAFLRFKVRTDHVLVKKAIDRFFKILILININFNI